MRKLLLILAILLVPGIALSANIPQSEEDTNGPYVWTQPVFNNSGGTLAAGSVVIWDIGSSTGDNDNYVTTTTTAGTSLVAGVIYQDSCADQDVCKMAFRGVVPVLYATVGGGGESSLICTSGTAAKATSCTNTAVPGAFLGIVTTALSGGQVNAMILK